MPFRFVIALLAFCALLTPWALAESTDCNTPVIIVPDGRLTQSTFPQATTHWYAISTQAGHSYSVEFGLSTRI